MTTFVVHINACELAERSLETRDCEKFPVLVTRAQELIKAKSEWRDMPNLESPAGIEAGVAWEAFLKEYKSYCEKYDKDTSLAS
jgi:hypothetical protein